MNISSFIHNYHYCGMEDYINVTLSSFEHNYQYVDEKTSKKNQKGTVTPPHP